MTGEPVPDLIPAFAGTESDSRLRGNDTGRFSVRFLHSNNRPNSVTRLIADSATVLTRWGIPCTVMFPSLDWWDYKHFTLSRQKGSLKWKGLARLTVEGLAQGMFRRDWCGFRLHPVDPRVRGERYGWTPSASRWTKGEVAVVHQPYLVPHLLRTLPSSEIRMVSAVHVNLEKAMDSSSPEASAWFRHWVAFERYLSIPRYATSIEAKEAAQRLGIRIDRLIYGGIDLNLFRPSSRNSHQRPLVITLYCDPNIHKGRETGVEVFRGLKARSLPVQLRSLGHVSASHTQLFDRNLGYLNGTAYAKALQESDIFVYPSWFDGFPAPPLQAMACGAALVSTSVEGVRAYARDGENCLLADPRNPAMLSHQILQLLEQPELRQMLQENGPHTAEAFSIERSTKQLLEFLEEVSQMQPLTEAVENLA